MAVRYPCFVINLDRQPDRYATFRRWNADTGLAIERFPASDGVKLDEQTRRAVAETDDYHVGMIGNAHSHKRLWEHAKDIGRPIVVFEDDAVLRRDIVDAMPKVVRSIGGYWDVIMLGFNTDSMLVLHEGEQMPMMMYSEYPDERELEIFRNEIREVSARKMKYTFGVCGYMISPFGANNLLEKCFPMGDRFARIKISDYNRGFPANFKGPEPIVKGRAIRVTARSIDATMNLFYSELSAYACVPPLVMTPNEQSTSTTR